VVPMRIDAGRAGVVPVLVLGQAPLQMDGQSLRPLGDNERLIGVAGPESRLPAAIFPSQSRIRARLDVADPLPGSALAWDALHAIVFEGRVDPAKLPGL